MGLFKRSGGNEKQRKKDEKTSKMQMYDHLLASLFAGNSIIEPQDTLVMDNLNIGFNTVSSKTYISKYFLIRKWPDWLDMRFMDRVRQQCLYAGVKINFYMYAEEHLINWDSDDMKNKRNAWETYSQQETEVNEFDYRDKRDTVLRKIRIRESWKYLNIAELEQKRTLCKMTMLVEFSGKRDSTGEMLYNMEQSIQSFKVYCANVGVKVRELRINLLDWLQYFNPLSLRYVKEVKNRVPRQVMTDDILATFNSYKQGKIGYRGMCIGMDVNSKLPVIKDIFANTDDAENWLVSAATGNGKSYFVKDKIFWALGLNIPVMIVDFEGDEYTNLYHYVNGAKPGDAIRVSMGKGNSCYCEPLIIPDITGNEEVDSSLKSNAIASTTKMLSVMVKGNAKEVFNEWESGVISEAIKNIYDAYTITEDPSTWGNSKGLRLEMIYDEICDFVRKKQFMDEATENAKHRAAMELREHLRVYFEEGASKYGTFSNPISVESLYSASLIVFSYGESGKTASEIDSTLIQLKQLSVANIMNQISNYCKYVKGTLNMKVIEEHQRWSEISGSNEILANIITGGRKRGDINFVITNDLNSMLLEDKDCKRIRQNLTSYAIGCIDDVGVRERFCELMEMPDLLEPLAVIAEAGKKRKNSAKGNRTNADIIKRDANTKYSKSFCVVLDKSDRAIVKVMLPQAVADTDIFKTRKIVAKRKEI